MDTPKQHSADAAERINDFIASHGVACGGNWAQMLMEAIRSGLPDVYAGLEDDRQYSFSELYNIIKANIDC